MLAALLRNVFTCNVELWCFGFNSVLSVWVSQGNCPKVSSINDRSDWKVVRKALSVIGFNEDEVEVRTCYCHTQT